MAQSDPLPQPKQADTSLGSILGVFGLLLTAAMLAVVAWRLYESEDPDAFKSVLASNLLQGAVIVTGGAVIAGLLRVFDDRRAKRGQDDSKRLELLRRMRAAHVRITHAQRLIRAEDDARTYGEQMRGLILVARDLEEIREDVRVTKGLYRDDDRGSIMTGIAQIILFLEKGNREYMDWCKHEKSQPEYDHWQGAWLANLIKIRVSSVSLDPSDEGWEPPDSMPEEYEEGLAKSKRKMRHYVYGALKP